MTERGPWRGDDPDLAATGAAMRAEWRAEQEAATRDAAEAWQHSRTLADVLVECMHRGDRVALVVGGHRVVGEVVDVGDDVVSVMGLSGRFDVHLAPSVPCHLQIEERARYGGRRADSAAPTFRARLLDREAAGDDVSLATLVDSETFDGQLHVGADVVVLRTRLGAQHYFPLSAVVAVTKRVS
jgi:hypothetical protein